EKAAIQNLSEAQYNLANIYSDGSLVKQDNKKALELYTKVAEKGIPAAQNNLAYMYANVYSDYENAKFWFKKAADNGYEPAKEALEQFQ
ncbi:TPA: tetratricopeptide repeat protein, partial [Acinetobacter baumannii]